MSGFKLFFVLLSPHLAAVARFPETHTT
jgi:hypothetical protein